MALSVANAARREDKPLIEGRNLRCPRCKKKHDVLLYRPLEQMEEYASETSPVYTCPSCRWKFALTDPPLSPEMEIAHAVEILRRYAPYALAPEYQEEQVA